MSQQTLWSPLTILFDMKNICENIISEGSERGQHHDHDQRQIRRGQPQRPHAALSLYCRGQFLPPSSSL